MTKSLSVEILKFKHPFTCLVAGTTSSGKTSWVRKLLKNWPHLISNLSEPNLNVLWCHVADQSLHNSPIGENVNVTYNTGLPRDIENMRPDIIVIDDLMNDINDDVKNLFTKDSHHNNISVIYIVQNVFNQNKRMRDISLNTHYIVIMRGLRLTRQVGTLGEQIFPNKSKQIIDIYKRATEKKYSYLLFDLHPQSDEKFSLRTRIFKEELPVNLSQFDSVPIFYQL